MGVARGRRMMKRREKMLKKGRKGSAGRWAELRGAYNIRAKKREVAVRGGLRAGLRLEINESEEIGTELLRGGFRGTYAGWLRRGVRA